MTQDPDPIDRLLALPPSEFVSARNQLAAALKKTDAARAAEIKELPKPTPSVWATNQVAHRSPDRVAAFLAASDELEKAQAGRAGAGTYQETLTAQRQALDRLVAAAAERLTEAGLAANRTVLDRVTNNLRWAVLADDSRRLLTEGRLLRDLEAPDFSALVERMPLAGESGHRPRPEKRPVLTLVPSEERAEHKRLEKLRAEHAAAKEQVAASREEVRRAKAAVDEADHIVTGLRRETAAAERKAAEAARHRDEAESALQRRLAEMERLEKELRAPHS
jgi:hypothetical protein